MCTSLIHIHKNNLLTVICSTMWKKWRYKREGAPLQIQLQNSQWISMKFCAGIHIQNYQDHEEWRNLFVSTIPQQLLQKFLDMKEYILKICLWKNYFPKSRHCAYVDVVKSSLYEQNFLKALLTVVLFKNSLSVGWKFLLANRCSRLTWLTHLRKGNRYSKKDNRK
jgi:hypothetical protein